jgi:hypothetical protein
MDSILNNKMSDKTEFRRIYLDNINEFNDKLRTFMKNKNFSHKELVNCAFYVKMLVESCHIFKYSTNNKVDFSKLYEDIDRMDENTL